MVSLRLENYIPRLLIIPVFFGFLSEDIFLGNSHIYPPDPANYVLGMEKPRLFPRKSMLRGKILIGAIHSAHVYFGYVQKSL